MSASKLYEVSIRKTLFVVAENEAHAKRVALMNDREEAGSVDASVATVCPDDWIAAIPWGRSNDMSCRWWLAQSKVDA